MSDEGRLAGSPLHEQITDELVGIYTRHLGRGPANAVTFRHENVVVTLMQGVLSKAEKLLADNGNHAEMRRTRELFRGEMEAELRAAVERTTGRRVRAFVGASQLHEDVAAEIFILDGAA